MKYIELLGNQLKSDEVIEFLEMNDLEVIYEFDRSHENEPDCYWVSAFGHGVQMKFNDNQQLRTIFFYILPDEGFSRCDPNAIGIPVFASRDEIRSYANEIETPFTEGETDFLGIHLKWIRIEYPTCRHHWQFRGGRLHRMSATLVDE